MAKSVSERAIIFLIASVQFINVLDFMMVMPLGPDFATALGIPLSNLAYVTGSYTAAAALAGLVGSTFLDRFDRRSALTIAMLGLAVGTAAGGFATSMATLLAARIVAGAFGGPATSLALSVVADLIPVERRGKAMGTVMVAFAVASILGVPAGLKLATLGGWRAPFLGVAAVGVVITICAALLLPPLREHLAIRAAADADEKAHPGSHYDPEQRNTVLLSYTMTVLGTIGVFVLIPNISAYVQTNLGFPRSDLEFMYFIGGLASFVAMPTAGRLIDRFGAVVVGSIGTVVLMVTIYAGFVEFPPRVPVAMTFVAFMLAMAFRNVAYNTMTSRVPRPADRARFMSMQSAVNHASLAGATVISAQMLTTLPSGGLGGMPRVAATAIVMALVMPVMLWVVQVRVVRAEKLRSAVALAHLATTEKAA